MAWTNEQQQAITLRNSSLIVSAAAGSGKTSVALHRVAFLLYEGVTQKLYANNIVIMSVVEFIIELSSCWERMLKSSSSDSFSL